jgi:hypothetical protein
MNIIWFIWGWFEALDIGVSMPVMTTSPSLSSLRRISE